MSDRKRCVLCDEASSTPWQRCVLCGVEWSCGADSLVFLHLLCGLTASDGQLHVNQHIMQARGHAGRQQHRRSDWLCSGSN